MTIKAMRWLPSNRRTQAKTRFSWSGNASAVLTNRCMADWTRNVCVGCSRAAKRAAYSSWSSNCSRSDTNLRRRTSLGDCCSLRANCPNVAGAIKRRRARGKQLASSWYKRSSKFESVSPHSFTKRRRSSNWFGSSQSGATIGLYFCPTRAWIAWIWKSV